MTSTNLTVTSFIVPLMTNICMAMITLTGLARTIDWLISDLEVSESDFMSR